MSDTRPYGEPDETAEGRADVVDGDARREVVETPAPATVWTPGGEQRVDGGPVDTLPARDPEPVVETTAADRADADRADDGYIPGSYSTRLYDEKPAATTRTPVASDPDAETVAVAPVATTGAAATTTTAAETAPAAQQPIFVQAPEAPLPRGNRGAAGAIGLLAALVFAILYLGVALALGALAGAIRGDTIVDFLLDALRSFSLWVPTAVFFIAFWLLGAFINRGRWAAWVVFGLLVGVAAYGGHIAGALAQAPFWTLTAREGAEIAESQLLAPLAIAAFVIGRELTIWFGAWVARRGRRMTELNAEAQREYERTLEAGPKLYAS